MISFGTSTRRSLAPYSSIAVAFTYLCCGGGVGVRDRGKLATSLVTESDRIDPNVWSGDKLAPTLCTMPLLEHGHRINCHLDFIQLSRARGVCSCPNPLIGSPQLCSLSLSHSQIAYLRAAESGICVQRFDFHFQRNAFGSVRQFGSFGLRIWTARVHSSMGWWWFSRPLFLPFPVFLSFSF